MARVVGRAKPVVEGSTKMKPSEAIVIACLVGCIIWGAIYYWNYRQTPGYALSSFLGAVNSGRVIDQYDLIDDEDKTIFTDSGIYEKDDKVPLALGYVQRIPKFTLGKSVPDPKDPNVVSIPATMQVVAGGGTKNLTDLAATTPYSDTFKMRKDSKGKWKVWLLGTFRANNFKLNLMQSAPSPRSTY